MIALTSPFGTLLRWKLSSLNYRNLFFTITTTTGYSFSSSSQNDDNNTSWVPWGTLIANLLAVIISILAKALLLSLSTKYKNNDDEWFQPLLGAIGTGFAGSLSTVSTWVKEIVNMKSPFQYCYCLITIIPSILLGCIIYNIVGVFHIV